MSYSDNFWYSESIRTILVISMFLINGVCLTTTCYYTYRLFKLRNYNFIQKRHPNLLLIFTLLSILTLINAPIQCAAFLNIWLRYAKWAVSLNLLLTFYAWVHVQLLRAWIFRFDCMYQRIVRNAAWKKELLGEEYELVSNKFTVFLLKYKHILGNDRKLAIIFIVCYAIFTVLMQIIGMLLLSLYQMIILLWLLIFCCGFALFFKKVPSYDDGLGISKETTHLKYMAFIFTPMYALCIILWRFDVVSEEVYRVMLCLVVTIIVFGSFLIMIRPINDNYGDLVDSAQNTNKSIVISMGNVVSKYHKYKLRHFLSDYKAFVLYSRQCVKELCAENLIFLFKVMEYKLKFAAHLVYGIETDEEYLDTFGYRLLFPKKLFNLSAIKEQLNNDRKKRGIESHDVDSSMRYLRCPTERVSNKKSKNNKSTESSANMTSSNLLNNNREDSYTQSGGNENTEIVEDTELEVKEQTISEQMDEISMKIYNEYIASGSIQQINISFKQQMDLDRTFKAERYCANSEDINRYCISSMNIADKFTIFDIAARAIEHMMTVDTFGRFKQTQPFRDFVKTWSFKP